MIMKGLEIILNLTTMVFLQRWMLITQQLLIAKLFHAEISLTLIYLLHLLPVPDPARELELIKYYFILFYFI